MEMEAAQAACENPGRPTTNVCRVKQGNAGPRASSPGRGFLLGGGSATKARVILRHGFNPLGLGEQGVYDIIQKY